MDVDQLIQLIQKYFLGPLNDLPTAQIKLLETNHDQSVQDFQNAIGLLFPPGAPVFQGQAADAFADYIGNYLNAEEALSPYAGNGISDRISTLLTKCSTILNQLEGDIKSIQGSGGWSNAGKMFAGAEIFAAPAEIGFPPDVVVAQVIIVGVVGIGIICANMAQQGQIRGLTDDLNQWANDMQNLAQEPDPPGSKLPPLPQMSKATNTDIATIQNLTPAQRQEVADIIAQLTAAGYKVDQWEIEALVRAGYDKATILGVLKVLNDRRTNFYIKGMPYTSDLVDLTTAIFTYETQAATSNLRFLKAAIDNRKPGQSIRSIIPDFDQLPKSVRTWLLMKPTDPFYKAHFGTAVEDLADQRIKQLPGFSQFAKQYGLLFNSPLPGYPNLIPDAQFTLPNGCIAVIDITSFAQVDTKQKYNVKGVCYIVVVVHGQP